MTPSERRLRRAYAIAPAVAPLAFCGLVALLYYECSLSGRYCNPAFFVVMPAAAIVAGLPMAYVTALLLMPLARRLQAQGRLTLRAVLAIAAGLTFAVTGLATAREWSDTSPIWRWFAYVASGVGPPIFLAALVFQRIAGTGDARSGTDPARSRLAP